MLHYLKFFLSFLLSIAACSLFCQQSSKDIVKSTSSRLQPVEFYFAVGNLTGSRANVDSFKSQTTINIAQGFQFADAVVYFSGAGFTTVEVTHLNGPLLSSIKPYINRCQAGSVVIFDDVRVIGKDSARRTIEGRSFALYGGGYDTAKVPPSLVNKEIYELIKKDFIAGTIYFSGDNFPNVVGVRHYEKELFKSLCQRSGPGSVISFDNCAYKDSAGVIRFVSKSLKFE